MHLSFVNANILHQVLDTNIHAVYNPVNNIFDKILYLLDVSFFVFGDNYRFKTDNCSVLPQEYIDLYNYDLCILNGIVNASQQTINRTLHVNTIILEHQYRTPNLKKEDLVILNRKTSGIKKIFFDQQYMSTWSQETSIYVPYGIPLNIFRNEMDTTDRGGVLINANSTTANQLQQYLNQENIDSKIFDGESLSLSQINTKLNNYRIVMNLNNDPVMTLVSIAAGCEVITLADPRSTQGPNIHSHASIDAAVSCLKTLLKNKKSEDADSVTQYLSDKHSFDLFKIKIQDLIRTTAKREAFIL